MQFAIERWKARELLKESSPFGNRDGRMRGIASDQQVQCPPTNIGGNIFGATRAPDRSSFFTGNRRPSPLGPPAPIFRQCWEPLFSAAGDLGLQGRNFRRLNYPPPPAPHGPD